MGQGSNLPTQLPLAIQLPDDETFTSFWPAGNEALLAHLQTAQGHGQVDVTYVWGAPGSGKSHLLHAACAQRPDLPCVYLPLRMTDVMAPEMLEGLEYSPLICIDDIEQVAGQPEWERKLFDLYNRIHELQQGCLLISANAPARRLPWQLPDLRSRLDWGTAYRLVSLSDDDKLEALQMRARGRGLQLGEDAGRFLLNHCARDMRSLWQTLDRLDHASIAAQRRLTIPFIKEALSL